MAFSSVYTSRSSRITINTSEGDYLTTDSGIVFLHTEVAKKHGASGKVYSWTEGYVHAKTTHSMYRYKRLLAEPGYYEHTLELAKNSGYLRQKCKDVIFKICENTDINFNQIIEDLDVEEIANLIMSSTSKMDENMSVVTTCDTIDTNVDNRSIGSCDSDSTWLPINEARMMAQNSFGYEARDNDNVSMITCSSDEDSSSDFDEEELGF